MVFLQDFSSIIQILFTIVFPNVPEWLLCTQFFLLENSPDSTHYLVNYDKSNKEASTVNLSDLLVATAIEKPVCRTIFKVRQQTEEKEPNKDLYHSVDRELMTTLIGMIFE